MIKNIIFDLGNVLLKFKPEIFLLELNQDENYNREFIAKIIRTDTWLKLDRGVLSMDEALKIYLAQYPEEKQFIRLFFARWMEMLTPINENVEVLKSLKNNHYYIYYLSNFIKEAFEFVKEKFDFFDLFDGGIISSEILAIKPEIEIYKALLNKYHLNPQESVFIDDVRFFTKQARKLGFHTIHYLPHADLSQRLKELNINI